MNKTKRIVLLTFSVLVLLLSLQGFSYLRQKSKDNQKAKDKAIVEETIKKIKTEMLSSKDPRTVTLGIAITYYPKEKLELKKNGGNGVYPFKFYGVELNKLEYTKLVDHFLSTNKTPEYSFHIEDMLYKEYSISEDMPWKRYWNNSGEHGEYLTAKNGFVCLYPVEEAKIDRIWYPVGYNYQFIAPPLLVFKCAFVAKPDDNTLERVAPFIKKFLSENNIACFQECKITDKSKYGFLFGEDFSMPNHTAQLGYTEKYDTFSEELINNLKSELQNVADVLKSTNWKVEIKDTTNPKLIRNWLSLNLTANNQDFECPVVIEVWGNEYQNYLYEHKSLREQYPQYSDEEFEKFKMGGRIDRSITCFKTLKEM